MLQLTVTITVVQFTKIKLYLQKLLPYNFNWASYCANIYIALAATGTPRLLISKNTRRQPLVSSTTTFIQK